MLNLDNENDLLQRVHWNDVELEDEVEEPGFARFGDGARRDGPGSLISSMSSRFRFRFCSSSPLSLFCGAKKPVSD